MSVSLESLMQPAPAGAGRRTLLAELGAFLVVGGAAALGFVALSILATRLDTGLPDWIVSAVCYALFIVPVYLLHRRFSFSSEAPHGVALPRYVAVQLSALALAALFSFICYRLAGLQPAIAATLVIVLTSGVNFLVLRLWAFARED